MPARCSWCIVAFKNIQDEFSPVVGEHHGDHRRGLKAHSPKSAMVAHEYMPCSLQHISGLAMRCVQKALDHSCCACILIHSIPYKDPAQAIARARCGLPLRNFPIVKDLARANETSWFAVTTRHLHRVTMLADMWSPAESDAQTSSDSLFSAARPQCDQHVAAQPQHASPRSDVHLNLNPCVPCELRRSAWVMIYLRQTALGLGLGFSVT